jgi:general secretion pathway protein G
MNFNTMVRNSRETRIRGSHKGFTLLELLLVMAILVVLAGLGTAAYTRLGSAQSVRAAKYEIKNIKNLCVAYKLQVGNYPKTLQDLVTLPGGLSQAEWNGPYYQEGKLPKDPWRNDYVYSANEAQDRVYVTSNGPDGAKGTADDIPGKNEQ